MKPLRNVFACLVHERPECVVDLVRNLRWADPGSAVLLYNGGRDPGLLDHPSIRHLDVAVHPNPRPLTWGWLHDFALDCMRFAFEHLPFDVLTIVDSDQLAVGQGYTEPLAELLAARPEIGLLGNAPGPQPRNTRVAPALQALKEIDRWRAWLRRFPRGEHRFVHWTFWPSTVFTAAAARDLVDLFDGDDELRELLGRTKIWASEEVLMPTFVALQGREVAANPWSYDFVRYRRRYRPRQIADALRRSDVFWVHPVSRRLDDPLRSLVRKRCGDYRTDSPAIVPNPARNTAMMRDDPPPPRATTPRLLLTQPILERMRSVEGWLEDDEADLLIAASAQSLRDFETPHAIVEVGSYCGRSTVVLGSVAHHLRPGEARVFAVDPHRGQVGASDQGLKTTAPTFGRFRRNVARAGLDGVVEPICQCSYEVAWDRPIGFLLIDGLHDYTNVSRDFLHFEPFLIEGGYVAFHDYADYYPGVMAFVDELLAAGRYQRIALTRSLIVLRRGDGAAAGELAPNAAARPAPHAAENAASPLVSCLMPTADRRRFVAQAVRYFERQDYPRRELVVVDDGADPVADLLPEDPRIRYLRLDRRRNVGAKRNLACREAHGEILLHWDDDDWQRADRVRLQVEALLAARADVCGLDRVLFFDPAGDEAWQYVYPQGQRSWLYGGTLCYTRDFWRRHPFADLAKGEDNRFVWSDRSARLVALPSNGFYVGLIHDANTSPKRTRGQRWQRAPIEHVLDLLGGDLDFYAGLVSGNGP